jgi:hypothetical protein
MDQDLAGHVERQEHRALGLEGLHRIDSQHDGAGRAHKAEHQRAGNSGPAPRLGSRPIQEINFEEKQEGVDVGLLSAFSEREMSFF